VKLPNREKALVPESKIVGYLLAGAHPHGQYKAAFFVSFGFSLESPSSLASALKRHAADQEVARVEDSRFGTRYIIESVLEAPDGRKPAIRSVWFIEAGEELPRFVTAYPLARRDDAPRGR
jgi:hypothetical protein